MPGIHGRLWGLVILLGLALPACSSLPPPKERAGIAPADAKTFSEILQNEHDDSLWKISGAQFDEVRRAWNAVQPLEPDLTVAEFEISYSTSAQGDAVIGFFRPRAFAHTPDGKVTILGGWRGYEVFVKGAEVTVFKNE